MLGLIILYIVAGLFMLVLYFHAVARYFGNKAQGVYEDYGRFLYRRVLTGVILKTFGCILLLAPLAFTPISILIMSMFYINFLRILFRVGKEWKSLRYSTEILLTCTLAVFAAHFAIGMVVRGIVVA